MLHKNFRNKIQLLRASFQNIIRSTSAEITHLGLIGKAETEDWYCRGNLISDKHVLTSYQCVHQDSDYDAVAFGEDQEIVFGIAKVDFNGKSLTLITLDSVVR